jgi:hypothetical protein
VGNNAWRQLRKGLKRKYRRLREPKPRNWSEKPGFQREELEMRPIYNVQLPAGKTLDEKSQLQ